MKKYKFITLLACCLQAITLHLNAETITYDFSSPSFWRTESNGSVCPQTGTSATIEKIYYAETNDCFTGMENVYFNDNGYLMLNTGGALKLPYHSDWVVNKVTLHSHSSNATTATVNIHNDKDGLLKASTALTWSTQDADYVYEISSSYKKSTLYIVAKKSAARITSITIDYTAPGSTLPDEPSTPDDEPEQPSEPNDGSKSKPYTVADIKGMTLSTTTKGVYIKGVIYGTINDQLTTSNFVSTNLVIGDAMAYVPIELPQGSIRNEINLKDHCYLQGKEILIKGNFDIYYNKLGLISPTEYEITYDVPINRYGYASLFLDMPVAVPEGSVAYYCTTSDSRAYLLPVGDIIPANVGVIIESTPNTTCTFTYTTAANADEEYIRSTNQLKGFTEDTDVTDGNAYYALNVKDDEVGFYIPRTAVDAADASKGFTAKAYKAYLQVPEEHKAAMFIIHYGNDETSIIPATHTSDEVIYDLQGRVVSSPATGVYIIGGKKVFISNEK